MITKALYVYEHQLKRVKITFYQSGRLACIVFTRFNCIEIDRVAETGSYFFRNMDTDSSFHLVISKRVFEYLSGNIAAYPDQDEIPF